MIKALKHELDQIIDRAKAESPGYGYGWSIRMELPTYHKLVGNVYWCNGLGKTVPVKVYKVSEAGKVFFREITLDGAGPYIHLRPHSQCSGESFIKRYYPSEKDALLEARARVTKGIPEYERAIRDSRDYLKELEKRINEL